MQLTQVNPIPGAQLEESRLHDLVLEPGEQDQALFRTYVIPDTIKTVQLRSTYRVPGSAGLSWNQLSAFDVGSDSSAKDLNNRAGGSKR